MEKECKGIRGKKVAAFFSKPQKLAFDSTFARRTRLHNGVDTGISSTARETSAGCYWLVNS
jgi:hypothetical protein